MNNTTYAAPLAPLTPADHALLVEPSMDERLMAVHGLTPLDVEAHHDAMERLFAEREISLQKWPEQLYGGDGPWNNYGEDQIPF
jgi:hypothetical protein